MPLASASRRSLGLRSSSAGCGDNGESPFRIGLITDCYGIFSGIQEPTVASASLPLIERGAEPSVDDRRTVSPR